MSEQAKKRLVRTIDVDVHEVVIRVRSNDDGTTSVFTEFPACGCEKAPDPSMIAVIVNAVDRALLSDGALAVAVEEGAVRLSPGSDDEPEGRPEDTLRPTQARGDA